MTRKDELRGQLINEIERVFDSVRREDGVTLHEADVMDMQGTEAELEEARALDREDRWQDVPDDDIADGADSLPFFDDKGLRYYLPAYMQWVLREPPCEGSCTREILIYTLVRDEKPGLAGYFDRRVRLFTEEECRVVCRFLWYIVEFDDEFDAEYARKALDRYWGKYCDSCGGEQRRGPRTTPT